MMKKLKQGVLIFLSVCGIFVGIPTVFAASNATMAWSGSSTVNTGASLDLTIGVSNIQGSNMMGASGIVTVSDTSCLTISALTELNDASDSNLANGKFNYSSTKGTSAAISLIKVTLKASSSTCTTTVNINEPKLAFTDSTNLTGTTISTTVSVVAPSSDANLKTLVPGAGTLSPAFNPNTTSYTVTGVPYNSGTIAFNVSVNDPKAGVTSGRTCTLSSKTTTCNIVVKAEDGTTKTYSVVVTRDDAPLGNDATLSSLGSSGYTISPTFNKDVTSYTINNVNMSVSSINFSAVPTDSKATVTGTSCSLSGMSTTCSILVTAENGTTKKTYNVVVNKKEPDPDKSNDATLKSLTADGFSLSPSFNPDVEKYVINNVSRDTGSINFNAIVNDSKASVSGTSCNLDGDTTTCSIQVTAEDGSTKTYAVVVNKQEPEDTRSSDNTLKSLDLGGQGLNPVFTGDNMNYTFTVENNVTGLDVHAIPNHEAATVSISGESGWKEGNNTVRVVVKAENGAERTYVINVYRKPATPVSSNAPSKSSNNLLESIMVNNGELAPSFDKNTNNYTVNVPNDVTTLDLRAFAEDDKATVQISGHENLQDGMNVVTIEVTAEDGSVRIYTINVNRSKKESQNKLKNLIIANGELVDRFDPNIFEYEVNVTGKVDKLDLTAIPEFDSSTVEIIGNENLQNGTNSVLIKVTDENGFVQFYRLTVNKTSKNTFLGLTLGQWLTLLGMLLLVGLLIFIIFLILRKKDDEDDKKAPIAPLDPKAPIIDFKPEFNFGSKNGTDDDVVEAGGVLNQYTGIAPKDAPKVLEAKETTATYSEVPYDPYDETITKDEMYDALNEAMRTKDSSKLKMLYEQEKLNRQKKELKKKEEMRKNYQRGLDED